MGSVGVRSFIVFSELTHAAVYGCAPCGCHPPIPPRVDPQLAPNVPDWQRATLDLAVDRLAEDVRNPGGVGRREKDPAIAE